MPSEMSDGRILGGMFGEMFARISAGMNSGNVCGGFPRRILGRKKRPRVEITTGKCTQGEISDENFKGKCMWGIFEGNIRGEYSRRCLMG